MEGKHREPKCSLCWTGASVALCWLFLPHQDCHQRGFKSTGMCHLLLEFSCYMRMNQGGKPWDGVQGTIQGKTASGPGPDWAHACFMWLNTQQVRWKKPLNWDLELKWSSMGLLLPGRLLYPPASFSTPMSSFACPSIIKLPHSEGRGIHSLNIENNWWQLKVCPYLGRFQHE